MGLRFTQRIRLFKGLTLNLNKSGRVPVLTAMQQALTLPRSCPARPR
jgi:hypothetical protein